MRTPEPDWHWMRLADGRALSYRLYGDPMGAPLIALHGAPATGRMYRIMDALARRLRVRLIAPDRPGYAGSTHHPGRTLLSVTQDHLSLVDHLGLGHIHVLGISGGGPYAAALAAALGERVVRLSLISPVGELTRLSRSRFNDRLQAWFFLDMPRMALLEQAAPIVRRGFFLMPRLQHRLFALTLCRADRLILRRPEILSELNALTADAMRHDLNGGVSDLKTYSSPWNVDLSRIVAPTVVWQGTADVVVPPEAAYDLAAAIPGALLHRLPDAGHFWVYDHLEDVLRSTFQS